MHVRRQSTQVTFVPRSNASFSQPKRLNDNRIFPVESTGSKTPWTVPMKSSQSCYSPARMQINGRESVSYHHRNQTEANRKPNKSVKSRSMTYIMCCCCCPICLCIIIGIALSLIGVFVIGQKTAVNIISTANTSSATTSNATAVTTVCPTTPITTVASASLPSECTSYTTITDDTRHVTFFNTSISMCDNVAPFTSTPAWFRFSGAAGSLIATCAMPSYHCGTYTPGYYTGLHPSTAGNTLTGSMCFKNSLSAGCFWTNTISITNCNGYYVYSLTTTPSCDARYCTI